MSWGRSNRLSRIFDPALPRSVVLRVSGGTSVYADGFEAVAEAAMVPVVVAGGKRLGSVRDALALAGDAVAAGAAGIDFGRNVWQDDHPVAALQALRAVVHHGQGVEDALDLYQRLAGAPVPASR